MIYFFINIFLIILLTLGLTVSLIFLDQTFNKDNQKSTASLASNDKWKDKDEFRRVENMTEQHKKQVQASIDAGSLLKITADPGLDTTLTMLSKNSVTGEEIRMNVTRAERRRALGTFR